MKTLLAVSLCAALAAPASAAIRSHSEGLASAAQSAMARYYDEAAGICAVPERRAGYILAAVGDRAPDFTAADADGHQVRLSALRGRVVLLDFFTTWCPPCVASSPFIQGLHDRLGSSGLTVLAINQGQDAPTVRTYAARGHDRQPYTYRMLLDEDESIGGQFSIEGYPTFVVIGKDGRETYRGLGFNQAALSAAVTAALAAR